MYHRPPQDGSAAPDQGAAAYHHFSAGTPYGYSPFSASMSAVVEHPYHHPSPHHLSPRQAVQQSPLHKRQGSLGSQAVLRQATRSMSPRVGSATPVRNIPFKPTDRALPSKDVTADTITDAYVAFILYCNPSFPLDVDTSTLKTSFQSPPRSDNKDFEPFRLFELLGKLESKEIKTWGQLALDLGVEAPDISKGQSTQKVQQYTVRLKRWMRAMHVDAFFEYLLGKEHAYFLDIPHPSEPHPPEGRDGVVAEEDLAVRALDPSLRPKRGRRRNSDAEQEENEAKQPRLMGDTPITLAASPHPMSMGAFSAHPVNANDPWAVASAVTPQTFAPWADRNATQSAISTAGPSHFRWHIQESSQDPSTPHPLSAHPSTSTGQADALMENEPKSAVTPSTRRRRKHGPAVSSAWPSSSGPNAKPRGRPPASRNTQDGPFSTFPADPTSTKAEPGFVAPVAPMEVLTTADEQRPASVPISVSKGSDGSTKPGRLSLQVPPHTGGPVRLATPPRLLVNGETNDTDASSQVSTVEMPANASSNLTSDRIKAVQTIEQEAPGFAFETLKRSLVSDLLRAELCGRLHRLTGDEAKRLADAVLERLNVPRGSSDNQRDETARLTAASWLGLGEHLHVPLGPAIGYNKRVTVTRFRLGSDGYEEIVPADPHHTATDDDGSDADGTIRQVYDLSWTVRLGSCTGAFDLKGLSLSPNSNSNSAPARPGSPPDIHDRIVSSWVAAARQIGIDDRQSAQLRERLRERPPTLAPGAFASSSASTVDDASIDWKSKYLALEFGAKMAKGEFDRFRNHVIEKLFDAVLR